MTQSSFPLPQDWRDAVLVGRIDMGEGPTPVVVKDGRVFDVSKTAPTVSALLEKWGCEVETHSDGLNVITDCDIIIADFDLGTKISGSECIAAIREQRGWEVPAMIMTGHEIERIRSMLTHMNISILAKPVRPPELRATLLELTKHFAREAG